MPKYPDVVVQLSGTDGNAFAIIGAVSTALKDNVSREAADRFRHEAFRSKSYDELLQFVMETVDVR